MATKARRSALACTCALLAGGCSGNAPVDDGSGGSGGGGVGGTGTGGETAAGGGSGGVTSDAGGTPGAVGGTSGSGGAPTGTCGEPPLQVMDAPVEVSELIDAPLPPPQGGTLVDGTYDATSQVYYGDFNLDTLSGEFRQVMRVREGGTILDSFSVEGGGPWSDSFSMVPSGVNLELTPVCPIPADGSLPLPYTATPGGLQLYVDYGSVTAIVTHVLRE